MYFLLLFLLPILYNPYISNNYRIIKVFFFFAVFFFFLLFKKDEIKLKKTVFVVPFLLFPFLPAIGLPLQESFFYFSQFFSTLLFISIFDFKKTDVKKITLYLSLSTIVVSIFGIFNFYGYSVLFNETGRAFNRGVLSSTIGNTNFTADFLASALPIIIFAYFKSVDGRKTLLYWISGTLSSIVVLWCQTRSIYFALFFSLLLFLLLFLLLKRNHRIKLKINKVLFLLLSFIIAFGFFMSPPGLPESVDTPFETAFTRTIELISDDYEAGSAYKRELEWETSFEMFKEQPILGHGWASFKFLSADYQMKITASNPKFYGYYQKDYESHSDWLQFLAEGGIVLFATLLVFVVCVVLYALKKIIYGDLFMVAVFCAWLITLIHSFVEFPFHMQPSLVTFSVYSAILLCDFPKITLNINWKYLFVLFMIPVLYVGGRFYLADFFTIQSKMKDAKLDSQISEFEYVNKNLELKTVFEENDSLEEFNRLLSTSVMKDNMDLIFLSKYGLVMNPYDTFINGYLSAGIYYLKYLPENNQNFISSFYSPYPTYKKPEPYAVKYRKPPVSYLTIPENSNYELLLKLAKIYAEIRMNVVNMPLDPIAMNNVGHMAKNAIILMKDDNASAEILEPWYEWMKYAYRLALRMRGRDSSDWYCIDIEFLNALLETEGVEEDFQEEFVIRLKHRAKLIEYGFEQDLPALWYEFLDKNQKLLKNEYSSEVDSIIRKIARMVNENR